MSRALVKDGGIELYNYVDNAARERVRKLAMLPNQMAADWNGEELNVIDWKINGETVKVTYQTRNDAYAPILDCVLALQTKVEPILPPGRSKAWRWNEYSGYWLNSKTGQRVTVI